MYGAWGLCVGFMLLWFALEAMGIDFLFFYLTGSMVLVVMAIGLTAYATAVFILTRNWGMMFLSAPCIVVSLWGMILWVLMTLTSNY